MLRDIVGDYIGGNSRTRIILHEIQILAYKMKLALVKGDIDKFAGFLNQHWDLSKELDIGSSNTCIDYIFHVIDDLIDGRMICGAGGGGFLQVIMKKEVKIEGLRNRLNDVFQDSGVDVWECELI